MKTITKIISLLLIPGTMLLSCKNTQKENQSGDYRNMPEDWNSRDFDERFGRFGGMESSGVESISIENTVKYLAEDCVENYSPETELSIVFAGNAATCNGLNATEEGTVIYTDSDGKKVTLYLQKNVEGTDAEAQGIIIEYKGKKVLKYSLSGNLTGTLKLKNKSAAAILELNGVNITSSATGPALHITSESNRTFLVVKEGTENTLTDSRILNQNEEMLNDKKGSVYAKGALIITGSTSTSEGGKLTVTNKGYKHAIYSHDYIRIQGTDLTVNCAGETSRDCIRTLNAVIIDGGNIDLVSKGTIYDDEGCGIKVEGEDADEDKLEVEYTAGAGFIVINGGTIHSVTASKGFTAHWKETESCINTEGYKVTENTSLLYGTGILNSDAEKPQPYLIINDGNLYIRTTLTPYENSEASCSPEGLEAKSDLIINGGELYIDTTDDSINAGGSITINGGKIYASSSLNDAIDSNGPSGITINGGTVVACGVSQPECAFDCDSNPFTINGGTVIGFGSSNSSSPSQDSKQKVLVLNAGTYAGKNLVIKQNGNTVFAAKVPSMSGDVIIASSPLLSQGSCETYIDGVITGSDFNSLYYGDISYSKGYKTESFDVESSVTSVNVNLGFGGGRGGMPGDRGGRFDGNPPEGFDPRNGTPPDGNFQRGNPPDGMPPVNENQGNRKSR